MEKLQKKTEKETVTKETVTKETVTKETKSLIVCVSAIGKTAEKKGGGRKTENTDGLHDRWFGWEMIITDGLGVVVKSLVKTLVKTEMIITDGLGVT